MEPSLKFIRVVLSNLSRLFILTIPGLLILEYVFKKGIITGNINTIYELILLLIWSIAISFPYYYVSTLIMYYNEIDDIKFKDEQDIGYDTVLIVTLFNVILTYIIYKTGINWIKNDHVILHISRDHATITISILISCITTYLFGNNIYKIEKKCWKKPKRA